MSPKPSHILLLKTLYAIPGDTVNAGIVARAVGFMSETEQVVFSNLQHQVGNIFVQIQEELEQGLTDMAPQFPEETDPRKWDIGDWFLFEQAIEGHKFEQLYRTYAEQKPNIHLMWAEIESRL